MSLLGTRQVSKLTFAYCKIGGSSRGMRCAAPSAPSAAVCVWYSLSAATVEGYGGGMLRGMCTSRRVEGTAWEGSIGDQVECGALRVLCNAPLMGIHRSTGMPASWVSCGGRERIRRRPTATHPKP